MVSNVPVTLMRVSTEREGLQALPGGQTWQECWQWWTDRPPSTEATPAWRARWQRWMGRLHIREAAPVPGRGALSLDAKGA